MKRFLEALGILLGIILVLLTTGVVVTAVTALFIFIIDFWRTTL